MKFVQLAVLCLIACLNLHTSALSSVFGQEPSLSSLRPLLRENTLAIAIIDSAKLQSFSESLPEMVKKRFISLIGSLEGETSYLFIDLPFGPSGPFQFDLRMAVKQNGKMSPDKLAAQARRLGLGQVKSQAGYLVFDSALAQVYANSGEVDVARAFTPISDVGFARLEQAMKAVPSASFKILGALPTHVRRTYQELMPKLPKELGGGDTSVLLEGLNWLAFSIDANQYLLQGRIQSASPDAAQALYKTASKVVPSILESIPQLAKILLTMKSKVNDAAIEISANGKESLSPPLQSVTESLMQRIAPFGLASKQAKLKQIYLAVLNFESANRVFPPDSKNRNADGKPRLSWRVHVLPYLDNQMELYNQFHLDESWDSPHNIKLLARMPAIYDNGAVDEEGKSKEGYTCFLAPIGPGSVLSASKAMRFSDITDGSSNTIAIVEVKPENAKPWTAPDDYVYDLKDPASGLAGSGTNGETALVAYCDGSVRMAKIKQDIKNWLNYFHCNDGQYGELE